MRKIFYAMVMLWMVIPGAVLTQTTDDKINLHGLIVGDNFDAQKMKHAGLSCESARKEQLSLPSVFACHGKVSLVGEEFTAFADIEQAKGKRIIKMISLDRAMNDFDGHETGISFEDMEKKLVAFYGQPDVLRTESPLQPIQYADRDLAYTRRGGADTWYFPGNITVTYSRSLKDVQSYPPHAVIYAENIIYYAGKTPAYFNMPINHPFAVTLKAANTSHATWADGDTLIMRGASNPQVYGMKCVIHGKPPEPGSKDDYLVTLRCVDGFLSIAVPSPAVSDRTNVFLFKGNDLIANGYVMAHKADP